MASVIVALLLLQAEPGPADVPLTENSVVRFVSTEEGRQILAADDAFTASLSRFDLQCRLKTDKPVTLADWKAFAAQHVRPWEAPDVATVTASLERLTRRLARFRLPLPPVIRLIRTTGDEEAGAAYTRGNTIILPSKVLNYDATQLDRLLLHELFHILSRHDGAVRAKLYRTIGFELCEPIELPASLAPRRITNPDAPLIDCLITLAAKDGQTHTGAPVLYSAADYDAKRGGTLFQSLVFRLLIVEQRSGRWQPLLKNGEPVVINVKGEAAFLDKIGKNTNYIIHPDEILADNFVRLCMDDQDIPTPRITEEMRRVLAK
jgi:hypothetical protein